ncbi:MAG: metallophosphoesterase family protein [Planctomycetota bacterium]|nr:metallophosphoesterase family protein [Planctomycetota bacterium]
MAEARSVLSALFLAGLPVFASADVSTPAEIELIKAGATWRYLDDGTDQGTAWYAPAFDASQWQFGAAELGFGNGDEKTVINSIGSNSAKIITAYFRHEFQVKFRAAIHFARFRILCDDGAIVYLNGQEIARFNMPAGTVGYQTLASSDLGLPTQAMFNEFQFDHRLLLKGRNVLAVEVHQGDQSSDDMSFDLEMFGSDGHPVVSRGPYLQLGTSTTAIVRWRTDWPTRSALWLGPTRSALSRVVLNNNLRREHSVQLTGLKQSTRYYYAVGNRDDGILAGGDSTFFFNTAPPPGKDVPTRIWVVGDSGTGDAFAALVRDAYLKYVGTRREDVFLMLGDNAYFYGTDDEYQKAMFEMYSVVLRNKFVWPTLGNHDAVIASSSAMAGPYYDIFTLPQNAEAGGVASGTEAYYSFDYGQIHFICLNSQDVDRTATGAMAQWLKADLTATTARWLIAYFHHPPYSKGTHNSDDPLDSEGRMKDMREVFLPILESGGVDLVLTGHSHCYERSFLLDGHYEVSTTLTPSMIQDLADGRPSGDGAYVKPTNISGANEGAVYVVAGCSAQLGFGTLDHPGMCVGMVQLGSLVLDVSGDRLDAEFVDYSGTVQDSFTIRKGLHRSLRRVEPSISVSGGGTQNLVLDAGSALAGGRYQIAGSFGTTPGFQFGALHVPLNPDPWFYAVLAASNSANFVGTHGVLDGQGQAAARLVFPGIANPSLVGIELFHAFVATDGGGRWRHASNAVKLSLSK